VSVHYGSTFQFSMWNTPLEPFSSFCLQHLCYKLCLHGIRGILLILVLEEAWRLVFDMFGWQSLYGSKCIMMSSSSIMCSFQGRWRWNWKNWCAKWWYCILKVPHHVFFLLDVCSKTPVGVWSLFSAWNPDTPWFQMIPDECCCIWFLIAWWKFKFFGSDRIMVM